MNKITTAQINGIIEYLSSSVLPAKDVFQIIKLLQTLPPVEPRVTSTPAQEENKNAEVLSQ